MVESSIEGFEKNDAGYSLYLEGLPEGELVFSLSNSENPSRKAPAFGYFIPVIGVVGFVVLFIIGMISLNKFKKYKDQI